MPPTAGRFIARRYLLEEPIGQGAMGVVWRAHDQLLDRKVAVKEVLLDAGVDDYEMADRHERMQREAQTAARLNHPNIVTVHDVIEDEGRPWIVMELVPAPSLEDVLAAQGPLTAPRATRIGQQLLAALAAAHQASVLHRDVKPSNVLIAPEVSADGRPGERAVLTDFGIAQFEGNDPLTLAGTVIGSPGFTAPERLHGANATPASDLWSLGATLYMAVEGHGPYERADMRASAYAIMYEDAPAAPSAGRLAPLIRALLQRDPADRPSARIAARMFAEALTPTSGEPVAARRGDTQLSVLPAPPAPQAPPAPRAPRGEPTQTFPPFQPQMPAPPTPPIPPVPPNAGSGASSSVPEQAGELLRQFSWETGGSARPTRGRGAARRVRPGVLVAGLSVVVIAAIGAAFLILRPHPATPGRSLSNSTSASGSASPAAGPKASLPPVSGAPSVVKAIDQVSQATPPGYITETMRPSATGTTAGFSLDVPSGWLMNSMGQHTYQYTPRGSADGVTYVEVDLTTDKDGSMVAEAMLLAGQHAATFPDGYQPVAGKNKHYVQLEPVRGTAGALWQFDYVNPGTQAVMRMDVLLFTLDRQSYTVYMTAPAGPSDKAWNTTTLPMVDKILKTFEPLPA